MTKWWTPSSSKVIRPVPYLSMEARTFLDSIVKPEFTVLEFGGGGSTKWFSKKCKEVFTVESDLIWLEALVKQDLKNVMLVYGSRFPHINKEFDIILIDGEPVEQRGGWVIKSVDYLKEGGWIILDNANRPEYEFERGYLQKIAKEVKTIDANEDGTLYLVTEFYRL